MFSRREFLGTTARAGAVLGLTPELARALEALQQSGAQMIQRAIPSSGEKIPVIGLSFSNHATCADHAALKEVLRTFVDNGGKVLDSTHASIPAAEDFHFTAATELGIQSKVFWSVRGAPSGPPNNSSQPGAVAKQQIDSVLARAKVPRIDLVMLGPTSDPAYIANLKEEKKAGRVRYMGVQVIADGRFPDLESVMRNEPIDIIGVTYDVGSRLAEERILPLALERKIGVIALFPLGNNGGVSCGSGRNLFARVGNTPLPEWAAEFDAKSWSQFFLKYVISHPAVTAARVGTSNPKHMLDDIAGGIGRLPNAATRQRMAAFIDALPPIAAPAGGPPAGVVLSAAILDRYVGEYHAASGLTISFRRDGTRLIAKPGSNPEAPLVARSETRFLAPGGRIIEFQADGQGKVTGLVLHEGERRTALERK